MKTFERLISKIKAVAEPYKSSVLTVHAFPKTVFDLINSIQETYSFIDWTESIKSNKFIFEIDGFEFSFVFNNYMKENDIKVVYSSIYNLQNYSPYFQQGEIYSSIEHRIEIQPETKDILDFCIVNDIDFKILRSKEKKIISINSKNPYKYFFTKLGVNKESIDLAAESALKLIYQKIENRWNLIEMNN